MHPPYLIDYENKSKGQLDIQNPSYTEQHLSPTILHLIANCIKSSSSVTTRNLPTLSINPTILPSSVINIKSSQQKFKSQLSSFEAKNEKSKTTGNQGLMSMSSFNLAHLTE